MCIKNSCISLRAQEFTLLDYRFSMLRLFNHPSYHKFNSITCSVASSTISNLSIFKMLSEKNDAWYVTPNSYQTRLLPLVYFFFFSILHSCKHTDTHTQLYHMKAFPWNILQPCFEIQSSIQHTVGMCVFFPASDLYLLSRYFLPKVWDTALDFHLGVIWLPPGSPWHIPGIQNSYFCIKATQGK